MSASTWSDEVLAVIGKEVRSESRSKSGLLTALIFNLAAVITCAFAVSTVKLTPSVAAGFLWVTLLFAAVASLPRTFIAEEEQGTGDLLRLIARPHAVFWGKALYNLGQMMLTCLILSVLFLVLTGPYEIHLGLYLLSMVGGSVALAGAVTFCGALVAQGANRFVLAGTVSLPMLVPMLAVAVGATAAALGSGSVQNGFVSVAVLWSYGLAIFAVGPHLFAVVWKC